MQELIEQYKQIHEHKTYGVTGGNLFEHVKVMDAKSILDYGCGRSKLIDYFNVEVADRYDPAIKEFSEKPTRQYDLVLCTDVMEHIEEEFVDWVLKDLAYLGKRVFFAISLTKACEILPNGMNAHVTIKEGFWWTDKILEHFDSIEAIGKGRDYLLVWAEQD